MLDQEAVQAEYLHFLRGLDTGRGLAHVVEFAPFRCPPVVERVSLGVEMRLAQECRHQRGQQQHDQPRRIDQQSCAEARDRHDVLRLAEQLAHQGKPAAGLPPRPLKLVLELGILEILEVESRGMLHQAHAGTVRHPLRQETVDQRHHPAQHVRQHRQRELGEQKPAQPGKLPALPPALEGRRPVGHRHELHHVVDDQLADIEADDRQQRSYQTQQKQADREPRAGAPDHGHERPQGAQGTEALPQGARRGNRSGGTHQTDVYVIPGILRAPLRRCGIGSSKARG